MNTIEVIPSEKTFIEWVKYEYEDLNLTTEEAGLLLGYVLGHGCGVCLDATDTILLLDIEDPENGVVAKGFYELLVKVNDWCDEFLDDPDAAEVYHEQVLEDAAVIARIMDKADSLIGVPLGYPTVKELIALLSTLPENYCVTCCGAENYLYVFSKNKSITIDHERYLG